MTQAANLAALGTNAGTTGILPAAGGGTAGTAGVSGFKNRIINGSMVLDQRNAGASVTPTDGTYTLDRYIYKTNLTGKLTIQQIDTGGTLPAFPNALKVVSSSSYTVLTGDWCTISQYIEGYNVADLGWGSSSAKTITLSFWTYSSLTGTFGGSLQNSAANRSYPFSYTINSANTWEQKTITIAGDTSGTWLTTNGIGIRVRFNLGTGSTYANTAGAWVAGDYETVTGSVNVIGTSGATWYLTGLQFEVGSAATNFDVRSYGTELALCQRYYTQFLQDGQNLCFGTGYSSSTIICTICFPVAMRVGPTSATATGGFRVYAGSTYTTQAASVFAINGCTPLTASFNLSVSCSNQALYLITGNSAAQGYLQFSAEL